MVAVGSVLATIGLAACGGSSGGGTVSVPAVAPAKTYSLQSFKPAAPGGARAARDHLVQDPNSPPASPLTAYRKCCDPHAGVDLIIVRSDDSHLQYDDSDISPSGQVSQPVGFPTPGRYRVIIDAYPAHE